MPPYLTWLSDAADAITAELSRPELAARVPGCPAWTLAELGTHVGQIHRWVIAAIVEKQPVDEFQWQPDGSVRDFYRSAADDLLALLASTPPDAECWHFGAKPRTVDWWHRRQAHEATLHRWDAQSAVGTPDPIPAEIALDGLDEALSVFAARQVRLGRVPAPTQTVILAPDEGGEFSFGEGPELVLTGSAESLLLQLWGRRPGPAELAGLVP